MPAVRRPSRSGSVATSLASRPQRHHHHHHTASRTSYDDAVLQWASQSVSIPSAARAMLLEDLVASRHLSRSIIGLPCAVDAATAASSASTDGVKLDEDIELQISKLRADGSVFLEQFEKYRAYMRGPLLVEDTSSSSNPIVPLLLRECKLELCYLQNSESFFEFKAVGAELLEQQSSLFGSSARTRKEENTAAEDPNEGSKRQRPSTPPPSHSASSQPSPPPPPPHVTIESETFWHPSATDPRRLALMQTLRISSTQPQKQQPQPQAASSNTTNNRSPSSSSSGPTPHDAVWKRVDVITFDPDGHIRLIVRTLLPPVSHCATNSSASPSWSPHFGSFLPQRRTNSSVNE